MDDENLPKHGPEEFAALRAVAPGIKRGWDPAVTNRELIKGVEIVGVGELVLYSQGIGSAVKVWHPTIGLLVVPNNWIHGIMEF